MAPRFSEHASYLALISSRMFPCSAAVKEVCAMRGVWDALCGSAEGFQQNTIESLRQDMKTGVWLIVVIIQFECTVGFILLLSALRVPGDVGSVAILSFTFVQTMVTFLVNYMTKDHI
jgi:hypothetical protein